MTWLSWAVYYEGDTDAVYLDVLIPRLMQEILRIDGKNAVDIPEAPAIRLRRGPVEQVAREACKARDAFHLIFIHGDTGGRNLETRIEDRTTSYCRAMSDCCAWSPARCITICPRHETEAWILAEPEAVTGSLGYTGPPASIGLPASAAEAERLPDPKAILRMAVEQIRRRRRSFDVQTIFPAIAQRQSIPGLRQAASFAAFEKTPRAGLTNLGLIA